MKCGEGVYNQPATPRSFQVRFPLLVAVDVRRCGGGKKKNPSAQAHGRMSLREFVVGWPSRCFPLTNFLTNDKRGRAGKEEDEETARGQALMKDWRNLGGAGGRQLELDRYRRRARFGVRLEIRILLPPSTKEGQITGVRRYFKKKQKSNFSV